MVEVAPGVFVHAGRHAETDAGNEGDIANCGFIIGAEAVAIIDTGGGPAVGRRLRDAVRARTGLPIRYVINTHMHPDHVLGNAAFRDDGASLVAHRNFQAALMARSSHYLRTFEDAAGADAARDVAFLPVTVTVAERLEIDLGQRVIELVAHPPAHTDNDLTVFDRQTGTLWTGDLVFMERAPAVDGTALGWLRVLEALSSVPARRAVPGHGPPAAPWPDAAADLRRYLEQVVAGVRAVQKSGGTIQRAIAEVAVQERPRWQLFEEYHPRNVTAVFAELEWE
ncbi:MAG TPA: quinoprotein relay system zinc metallohydrolase 2 [Azospirillum sp.]|nr:quinoprotein relay system zinc metallohydrolase 2 [Azospirillum sp.]